MEQKITEKVEEGCFYIVTLENPNWLKVFFCRMQESLSEFCHYTMTYLKMPFLLL